jgi:uncharacterized membrane protein
MVAVYLLDFLIISAKNWLDNLKKMRKILASVIVGAIPMLALAQQTYQQGSGVAGLFSLFGTFLGMAVPIVISLAVVWFIFNVFMYAVAGDEEKKASAKKQMIWGIIGIFVMVSVWGLVNILQSTFNTKSVGPDLRNQLPL